MCVQRRQLCQTCFASLLKRDLLLKERICSPFEAKCFFFLEYTSIQKGHCRKTNRKSQKSPPPSPHTHPILKWRKIYRVDAVPIRVRKTETLGPIVQSIVSLTSSLVVKMLTTLVSTVTLYLIHSYFAEKKMWVAFANAKATHIFSANILAYMPYLMIKVLTIR